MYIVHVNYKYTCLASIYKYHYNMGLQSARNNLENFKMGLYQSSTDTGLDLRNNLLWFYDFDELSGQRNDSSLNAFDLTEGGTVGTASGVINSSATYPTGQIINKLSHPYESIYNLSNTDFTITGWFYLDTMAPPSKSIVYLGISQASNSQRVLEVRYSTTGNFVAFILSNGTTNSNLNVSLTGGITTGTWVFFAMRYNTTTALVEGRMNGDAWSSGTASSTPWEIGTQSLVFGNKVSDTEQMEGRLDEMGGWDRRLTDKEIEYLYNGGAGNRPIFISALRDDLENVLEDDSGNVLVAP